MSELALPDEPHIYGYDQVRSTYRDTEDIARKHMLSLQELRGKRILDLGAGYNRLQAELAAASVVASVVNVDLAFDPLQEVLEECPDHTTSVQARIEALPFPDKSADVILASYSLPFWSDCPEQNTRFFAECRRVLKVGGLLSIYPMSVIIDGPYVKNGYTREEMLSNLNLDRYDFADSPDWYLARTKNQRLLRAIKARHLTKS